jgi:hypothetical protein
MAFPASVVSQVMTDTPWSQDGLRLAHVNLLLSQPSLPMENGYAITEDGMYYIAVSAPMRHCSSAMIEWWFGWARTSERYKLSHPQNYILSEWAGPRGSRCVDGYIGADRLVIQYAGNELVKLKMSFHSPSLYFGSNWREKLKAAGCSIAICGRLAYWHPETGDSFNMGHFIHLIYDEQGGARIRTRYWLGDVDGVGDPLIRRTFASKILAQNFCQHLSEEMATLATILPDLYRMNSRTSSL